MPLSVSLESRLRGSTKAVWLATWPEDVNRYGSLSPPSGQKRSQQPGSNDTQQATVVSPPDADSTEFVIFQDEGEILSAQSNYHQIV
jgi:hypothetical protein